MSPSPVAPVPQVAGPLRLLPFRALRLSPSRVADPASARAFARPYGEVPERLRRWESQGHLLRDPQPALYVHEYTSAGLTIRGLVGALDLSNRTHHPDERVVLPHEGVRAGHAGDLADRMRQMRANPAPILLVHRAGSALRALLNDVVAGVPEHQFLDRARRRHRIWAIRDADRLDQIAVSLASGRALVADGHHRYAAYLQMQSEHPGSTADRGLAMLVDQDDTPLFVGAIHRVLAGVSFDQVHDAARRISLPFTELSEDDVIARLGPDHVVVTDADRWAALTLDLPDDLAAVELLHQTLLPALSAAPQRVGFGHSVEETLNQVVPRRDVAVLLPAPDVEVVLRAAAANRLLPEKATSFQPKPGLGVFIRSLCDSVDEPS